LHNQHTHGGKCDHIQLLLSHQQPDSVSRDSNGSSGLRLVPLVSVEATPLLPQILLQSHNFHPTLLFCEFYLGYATSFITIVVGTVEVLLQFATTTQVQTQASVPQ
jgi:hypothetical protein